MTETQAQQAGPERSRSLPRPASVEAAGPASPRLVVEEVRFRVSPDSVEARVTLAAGTRRFTGAATGREDLRTNWQLAAAATVTAIQQYLQQCAVNRPTPHVRLLDLAAVTTGIGHRIIHATLRLAHGSNETDLLGSALVRNDGCSTAVAAALDAISRPLGAFLFPPSEPSYPEQAPAHLRHPPWEQARPQRQAQPDLPPPLAAPRPDAASASAVSSVASLTLGVELTSASVRVAAVDRAGRVLSEAHRPTHAGADPTAALAVAVEAAHSTIAGLDSSPLHLAGIGLALSGQLRTQEGVCVSSADFPAWREAQLAAPFSHQLELPVSLIGATRAAALAEVRFGAAQGLSNVVLVRVGTEIEVAVISHGLLLAVGEASPGQAGHMVIAPGGPRCTCGESGCWQALAGWEALIARAVRDISSGVPSPLAAAADDRTSAITPALICRLAAAGDGVARNALEETARYLVLGLANLITLFDPEAVILQASPSSVGAALGHAVETALKASPRAHLLSRCVLLSPGLGEAGPVLGAAAWAAQHYQ